MNLNVVRATHKHHRQKKKGKNQNGTVRNGTLIADSAEPNAWTVISANDLFIKESAGSIVNFVAKRL